MLPPLCYLQEVHAPSDSATCKRRTTALPLRQLIKVSSPFLGPQPSASEQRLVPVAQAASPPLTQQRVAEVRAEVTGAATNRWVHLPAFLYCHALSYIIVMHLSIIFSCTRFHQRDQGLLTPLNRLVQNTVATYNLTLFFIPARPASAARRPHRLCPTLQEPRTRCSPNSRCWRCCAPCRPPLTPCTS